jgi:NAD(P)-dependent dehydrogenase (short-subunit alcohol dehydrogenase family)
MAMSNGGQASALALNGRVALVTGAAGYGIGTATVRRLAAAGATVVMNGTNACALADVKAATERDGDVEVVAHVADVADRQAVDGMIDWIVDRFGRLDVLVNNAATGAAAIALDELPDDVWRRDLDVMLGGAFYCMRAAARVMKRQKAGRLISVASCAAFRGTLARAASYAVAKAGVIGLTKQAALELAPFGITVNAIAPSLVDTPRIRRGGRRDDASIEEYARRIVPLGRVGQPQDVAGLIAFLASDEAAYITGEIIVIDGGASLASSATRLGDAPARQRQK